VILRLIVAALLVASPLAADSIKVAQAQVRVVTRAAHPWTVLEGRVEASTDLPAELLLAVITDWPSYPRLFSKIKQASVTREGDSDLVSETTEVSVLGWRVTNHFVFRAKVVGRLPEAVTVGWSQVSSDGTIDGVEGEWVLVPVTEGGRSGTVIRYRTASSVPQNIPGQDGLVGMFFPGELKQIVAAVLNEARKRKEKP